MRSLARALWMTSRVVPVRPHPRAQPVHDSPRCAPSLWTRFTASTSGFSDLSTIHTPYYSYWVSFNNLDYRRKAVPCAYPSGA